MKTNKDDVRATKINIFDNYFQAGILATNMADGAQLINRFEWDAL